jgi:stearoyl-CoA desaturase (Delta-9 desaturase)
MIELTILQGLLITLLYVHLTIVSYELYLHRGIIHNSVDYVKSISIIFEIWLWLTMHLPNKYYFCSHRIHHAYADKKEDPHGPLSLGITQQFLLKPLYKIYEQIKRIFILDEMVGGPPTELQKKFLNNLKPYQSKFLFKNKKFGNLTFLIINVLLFGIYGLIVYFIFLLLLNVIQHIFLDGFGHYLGYRNYQIADNSKNITPIAILFGGIELHNNHHKNPSSAKCNDRWFEIDIGWVYIKILMFFNLCKINNDYKK